MDKALKRKWVKELRSGAWVQTRGRLFNEDSGGFCCLGVLKELMPEALRELDSWDNMLTSRQERFAGLNGSQVCTLASMNDEERKNFNQIADWIEENL